MKKTINFNNQEVELRFSFLSDMIYENIMEKSFSAKNQTEWIYYMFSTYIALSGDRDFRIEDFIEELNGKPQELFTFVEWYLLQQQQIINLGKDLTSTVKKKKVTRKKSSK
jgi:hypothetical protein